MMLRQMKLENATVHGCRPSFRGLGWQRLQLPLAHLIGDKAE